MAKSRQEKMKAAALAAVNLYIQEESAGNRPSAARPVAITSVAQTGSSSRQNQWKHFGRQQIFHSRSHWQHGR
ncbi:MAG: hypothetical protein EXR59_03390 [Dehalococcoidia bacterium]|nr:hypothetical protein [Dehalococcoidia bacterium]